MIKKNKIKLSDVDEQININTLNVYSDDEPKIKIYDYKNNGAYYYREIGFTSELWKENKQ